MMTKYTSFLVLLVCFIAINVSADRHQLNIVEPSSSSSSSDSSSSSTQGVIQEPNYTYCQANKPSLDTYPVPSFASSPSATLVSTHIIHRHGDRTPCASFPSDTTVYNYCNRYTVNYINDLSPLTSQYSTQKRPTWPRTTASYAPQLNQQGNCQLGQLTDLGMDQHLALGRNMFEIYGEKFGLLPNDMNLSSIFVRSTDVWRTQQSVESFLNGFFSASSVPASSVSSIPVITYPKELETMFINTGVCPQLTNVISQLCSSSGWTSYLSKYQDLFDKLKRVFSMSGQSGWDTTVNHYFDNLLVRKCHQIPYPCANITDSTGQVIGEECINDFDVAQVESLGAYEYNYVYQMYDQPTITSLVMAAFLAEIRENLVQSISTSSSPHLFLYSGHDSTLAAMLGALNMTNWKWPPYASNIVIELWDNPTSSSSMSHNYILRVIYNGQLLWLPFCQTTECSWDEWNAYMSLVIPNDLPAACRLPHGVHLNKSGLCVS